MDVVNKWLSEHFIQSALAVIALDILVQYGLIPLARLFLKATSSRFRKRQVNRAKQNVTIALALSRDKMLYIHYHMETLGTKILLMVFVGILLSLIGFLLVIDKLGNGTVDGSFILILLLLVPLTVITILSQQHSKRESVLKLVNDGRKRKAPA